MKMLLPIFPSGTRMISGYVGVYDSDSLVQYIVNGLPIFSHGADDMKSFHFITSNLIHQKLCRKVEIQRGFHVSGDSVSRVYKKFRDKGEIIDFSFTQANVGDRYPLKYRSFHDRVFGKLIGDKGYISQTLFDQLFIDGIRLITKPRKHMKNSLMLIQDKILLRKRVLIETINDQLKNICQIEHTRHRSFENFLSNMISALIAYFFQIKKPSLNLD